MRTVTEKFKYLQRLARRWGGSLNLVTRQTYKNLPLISESPVNNLHAVDWSNRAVYVVIGQIDLPNIIHELGHVFASQYSPNNRRCAEVPWLGWEFLLARKLRILREWRKSYGDYGLAYIYHYYTINELSHEERKLALRKAIQLSRKRGLIKGNNPVPHPKRRLR